MLVFHFPAESPLTSADIEDDLAEALDNERDDFRADHVVDGNEIGDAIDIFVLTRDPLAAFQLCQPLLQKQGLLDTMIAAYRNIQGGDFVVIHPAGYRGDFRL
jgi:hypothetical protein